MKAKEYRTNARAGVVAAFEADLALRSKLLAKLKVFDLEIIATAIECFGSAEGAMAWLTHPAHDLRGKIPIEMKIGKRVKSRIILLLRMIEHGTI